MRDLVVLLLAYLLGSVPFGPILARIRGVDLRSIGSGNVGATNVGRALGLGAGRLVLALDAAKGAVAIVVARTTGAPARTVALVAIFAVLGHCFSLFLRGRGGKGAATALGVGLALVPSAGLAGGLAYALAKRATRLASVGTFSGLAASIVTSFALTGASLVSLTLVATGVIVVARHRENLRRLATGTELST